jgi:predicted DNA-binding ribbon-helix-helix protein
MLVAVVVYICVDFDIAAGHNTTTVRVSRRTHQVLTELAAQHGRSIADLLDELAENARRQRILDQSAARMAEVMADADQRRSYTDDLALTEAAAAAVAVSEAPYTRA